ncbi:MAG: sigma-70 family RNA polymerase sigma factor [Desulfobacterales bacterium]|nr:sigma-70 family RNA polymerase sigma factor [Desulfobacterales bacterium]
MNRSFEEDRQLLSECFAGDRKASETLVRQFSGLVYGSVQYTLMAKHVSFNRHDLDDLHNTVFLRLFDQGCKKLRQYEGRNGCSLSSWIRMIAVRTVLDHLRKKGVDTMVWQKKRITLEELPELKADGVEFEAQIEKAEQGRLLQDGMQRLPPRDRLFIKLHFDQGLSVAEVAEAMQLSIDNAYTVKHRAIQRLKSHVASATNIDS